MKKFKYESDIASLKLISKNDNKSFFLLNNNNDGFHTAYIFDNFDELKNYETNYKWLPITLSKNIWAISNYDCNDEYNADYDFNLDSDFIYIVQFDFYQDDFSFEYGFVLNKNTENNTDNRRW